MKDLGADKLVAANVRLQPMTGTCGLACESVANKTLGVSIMADWPNQDQKIIQNPDPHQEIPAYSMVGSNPAWTSSAARSTARALFWVSIHSFSGTESATMPAPA